MVNVYGAVDVDVIPADNITPGLWPIFGCTLALTLTKWQQERIEYARI